MIEALAQDGVDVEKFGFAKPKLKEEDSSGENLFETDAKVEVDDDDLPF